MRLWRLSTRAYARTFDGGYGLLYDGRWNTVGHAVTYCASSPALCVLEKLVHIEDPALLPELVMVQYEAPDQLALETLAIADLPEAWRLQESWTQQRGDRWHAAQTTALLHVPSTLVPLKDSPDWNVLINHSHPDAARIRIVATEPFALDVRLF